VFYSCHYQGATSTPFQHKQQSCLQALPKRLIAAVLPHISARVILDIAGPVGYHLMCYFLGSMNWIKIYCAELYYKYIEALRILNGNMIYCLKKVESFDQTVECEYNMFKVFLHFN
jgi:hypothetical protein